MLTEQDILKRLDGYLEFIVLNHPYVYLIDCRLNIFRNDNEQWCIVSEVLGYNPRGDIILLEIETFGNHFLQYQDSIAPIDKKNFLESIDGEALRSEAKYWIARGKKVRLTHKKQNYKKAGIELKEYEPGKISIEEAARFVILKYRDLFRATDEELYRLVPDKYPVKIK